MSATNIFWFVIVFILSSTFETGIGSFIGINWSVLVKKPVISSSSTTLQKYFGLKQLALVILLGSS